MTPGRPLAHQLAEEGPEDEQHGDQNAGTHEEVVGRSTTMWPSGVHSHAVSIVQRMRTPTLRRVVLAMSISVALTVGGCAGSAPEVPNGPDGNPDPVLLVGRDVFGSRCSSCHGSSGGGGTGSRLAGTVVETYPDIAAQVAVVSDGRNNMPSFGGTLSAAEIEAVVRYTREVLG